MLAGCAWLDRRLLVARKWKQQERQQQQQYYSTATPHQNRAGDVWHILLPRLDPTLLYGYRIKGRNQDKSKGLDGGHDAAAAGHRCDEVGCCDFVIVCLISSRDSCVVSVCGACVHWQPPPILTFHHPPPLDLKPRSSFLHDARPRWWSTPTPRRSCRAAATAPSAPRSLTTQTPTSWGSRRRGRRWVFYG